MILVDSSGQLYEIYKAVRRDLSEERAIEVVSALRRTTIEPLVENLALEAADIALLLAAAGQDARLDGRVYSPLATTPQAPRRSSSD